MSEKRKEGEMPEVLTQVDPDDSIKKFKADRSSPSCYCVCHSPVSSRVWCEHCTGDNDVGRRYRERTRLEREVIEAAKAEREAQKEYLMRLNFITSEIHHAAMMRRTEAVDALIAFESSSSTHHQVSRG